MSLTVLRPRGVPRLPRAGLLVLRRMLLAIPLTAGLTAVVFFLASVAPFNPLAAYLGSRYEHTGAAERAALRAELGLDDSWFGAWLGWLGSAVHGELGTSRMLARPVTEVLAERVPYTLLLMLAGLLLAVVLAVLLACAAGLCRGGLADRATTWIAQLAQAIPPFVLALVFIAVFSLRLGLPTGGVAPPGQEPTAGSLAVHLLLPATVMAISLLPWLVLNLRASMFDLLDSDAVLAARGRGEGAGRILVLEVLPGALLPFITVIGSRLGELITGALLVETVFGWPGIASAVIDSAVSADFALLAAVTACSALAVFLGNALADAGYLLLDPRVGDV
ncbi:peptide/nickel transport system permease protein [Arthrobacter sp. JUb119]|uniref:ABC transporter permease n=1 Tax=Micrococcaceae TaxID=1268 RepID=UPI000CFC6317|nr:ABC transporter permease [Arthrobacter sp. MYb214]MCS3491702.1 peptide/nickel transport system permease protein [Arthrobacter sp. JUb119]PRB78347.1 ABC transporter permease [Arthrobacter sp. MYb214]